MPFIDVKILEGRTDEQKRRLVKAITDAVVEICDAPRAGTTVIIEEYPRNHWATGGELISDRKK